jgi:hypothetical protein
VLHLALKAQTENNKIQIISKGLTGNVFSVIHCAFFGKIFILAQWSFFILGSKAGKVKPQIST